ncbi:MAG: hypothetical protein ACTH0V_00040 [Microbacteriaceae bacterium]
MSKSFKSAQQWDLRPLATPVDRASSAAYRRTVKHLRAEERRRLENERRSSVAPSRSGGLILRVLLGIALIGAAAVLVYGLVASLIVSAQGVFSGQLPDSGTIVAGIACLVALLLFCVWAPLAARRSSLLSYRLDRFARANGGVHDPLKTVPSFPSAVFEPGDHERPITGSVHLRGPRDVEFGNYSGGGHTRSTGYAVIATTSPLPVMTLVLARRSVIARRYPAQYDTSHRLELPEPFRRVFTLYAGQEAAPAASLLFDADLLSQLARGRRRFEVEVAGSRVLLYTRGRISTANPDIWQSVLSIVDAVVHRIEQLENRTAP